MTPKELNKSRFNIVKEFLSRGERLNLSPDFNLVLWTSGDNYHVFSEREDGLLTFQYSISESKLNELINSLSINLIKKIFTDNKILSLQNKFIAKNSSIPEFNPIDYENYS